MPDASPTSPITAAAPGRVLDVTVQHGLRVLTASRLIGELVHQTFAGTVLGPTPVVLVDGTLPSSDTDLAAIVADAAAEREAVLVMFCPTSPIIAAQWVELGVHGLASPDVALAELRQQIVRLSHGEVVLGVAVRAELLSGLRVQRALQVERDAVFASLTRREGEVLHDLAMGATPEEISRMSFISMNTVRTHIRAVLTKLDVTSVAGAVALAFRSGWVSVGTRPDHY